MGRKGCRRHGAGAKARTAAARQTGRGTDAAQKEMPQHRRLRLLPARQRPDRQGSAAALLWCIRPHFSVGPIAAGPPCPPPPFRTRGACPVDRWVEVFFPLRGRRPPPFGVRGAAAHWRPFSCARPGPVRGKTMRPKAEKHGEPQRIAENRLPTGRRTEKGRRAPKTGCSAALAHTGGSGYGCLGRRMPEPGGCRLLWQRLSRQPFRAGWPAAGAPSGGGRLVRRPSAEVCADGPARRPGAALLPDGGSRYNGRGGYAQRLPRAVLL